LRAVAVTALIGLTDALLCLPAWVKPCHLGVSEEAVGVQQSESMAAQLKHAAAAAAKITQNKSLTAK
jgi:hypothetical protein